MADLLAQLRTKLTGPQQARPALGHTPQRPMHVQFHVSTLLLPPALLHVVRYVQQH